ncbi:unknown [Clostridium sp. CAG:75]|nr:unknown [Clostridium sp. CAG:75]
MCGNEVLQYIKTLTEVRLDRQFDRTTGCIRHQTTHTCELLDLCLRTTGTGISHHEDVVVAIQTAHQRFCQLIIGCIPCIDNCFVTLFFCKKTHIKLIRDKLYCLLCFSKNIFLSLRHGHIGNGYRHCCTCGIFISKCFDVVHCLCSTCCTMCSDTFFKDLLQLLLTYMEINFRNEEVLVLGTIHKSHVLWQDLIEDKTTQCRFNNSTFLYAIFIDTKTANLDLRMKCKISVFVCCNCLVHALEELAFTERTRSFLCQIIDTKYHILRRYGNHTTIRWL